MSKISLAFLMMYFVTFMSGEDEFWLEPDRFYFSPAEIAGVHLLVGANFTGRAWTGSPDDLQRLQHHAANQVIDLTKALKETAADPLQVRLTNEGTHLLVAGTRRNLIKTDGEKFDAYLKEQGLDDIFYQREKTKTSGDSASEYRSSYSKVILQAGSGMDNTYKKICNLPIEIVPDRNPAAMKKGDPIKFEILYQGKPLFGAKVRVWNRYNHRTTVQNIYSQQDGMIETHVSNPGVWMVSVVNMVPSKDPHVQYHSFWGTLVFGVR